MVERREILDPHRILDRSSCRQQRLVAVSCNWGSGVLRICEVIMMTGWTNIPVTDGEDFSGVLSNGGVQIHHGFVIEGNIWIGTSTIHVIRSRGGESQLAANVTCMIVLVTERFKLDAIIFDALIYKMTYSVARVTVSKVVIKIHSVNH